MSIILGSCRASTMPKSFCQLFRSQDIMWEGSSPELCKFRSSLSSPRYVHCVLLPILCFVWHESRSRPSLGPVQEASLGIDVSAYRDKRMSLLHFHTSSSLHRLISYLTSVQITHKIHLDDVNWCSSLYREAYEGI